ncbi:hypothetical protein GGQ10_002132 [Salinibacter ruber]|uniref:hypothetical protein n=1 Tax=Salinibacter ruber TaxID=146919 RepID=UPI00216A0420|nr:hypothetical protein [Salinibacter ruber]MCS4087306.1 hypothetical protein [Salinibacter ruber]
MAGYGKKYDINWTTPTADCRLWVKQEGYTGGSTALDPAPTPVSIRWGEQGRDDLTSPLRISTARIRFIGDSDGEMVEEVFDGGDTEYRVKFWRDTQRDGSYELEWEGYLATDLWRDNPHLPAEVVELEAIDGLALLENREAYTSQDPSSGEWSLYDPSLALSKILRGWTPEGGDAVPMHDLPITTSQNWRPDGLDVGNDQKAQPLDKMDLYNTAFQELDDQEEVEETLDQRTQLEEILERFGLTLMLSGGEWRLRQRGQIGDGTSLKQWTMPTDQHVFGYSYTEDVTTDLPAVARTEKPRSRASRLQTLTSRYTYQDLGELVADGSFEDGFGAWTEVDSNATRVDYTDSPLATNSTQEDSFAVEMDYAFETEEEQPRIHLRQELNAALQVAGPRGSYQLQYDEWVETGTSVINATVGGQYELATERVAVASEARAADDGTLIVDPIPGSPDTVVIPAGAVLPIDQPAPGDEVGYITLSEPAFGEDERLQGDISRNVKTDWKLKVYKWAPATSGPSGVKGPRVLPAGEYQSAVQKIIVPQTTPQGDSVVGSMTVELGTRDTANGNPTVWVDHVSVQVAVQGEPIEETNYQLAGAEYGREQTLSHRIGDGPTKGHPRGLFDDGTTAVFRHWAPGPGQGKTGKLLEQLLVEQWMRQQRETLDRRTYECELRGSDSLKPHHVVGFDSKTYTVSFLERSYGTPGDSARVEMTELKDAGLDGLERTYSMNSSDSPGGGGIGGGGGFGGGSGGGGGGGSSTWDQLDGKPSGLFASNGDSDGFAETQALGNADITGALDLSSSTFLETSGDNLVARVKDEDDFASDSDTHLATQQSIKKYVQSATGALYLLDDVDLDATDQGVQEDDLLAYNGSIWTDRDPADIKVGNADKLDGYEASAFPRKAEDATITGQWTFKDRVTLDSTELRTSGAATGFAGSGTIIDDQESWFDDVQVRGTLFAREFEVKKLDVSRGEHIFGPGGGKVKEVVSQDGSTATLDFEENPGIKAGDYCLIKETNATGGAIAIEIRLEATSSGSTVDFNVLNSGDNTYRQIEAGDDVVVVASSNSGRDSMVYVNPYGPYIDTVDGLSDFSDWDNRSPGARFGEVGGMPSIAGQSPSGSGLWANNAYIKGTIVANQGAIADSVTIGGTEAKDLSGIYATDSDEGTTIIDGGAIATDLVTLDSIQFSPVETDSVVADINASTEGLTINTDKLDITAGDLNITAGDLKIGADTTFLSQEYDPTSKAPAADAGTMRQTSEPSARPSGESLQKGDMWLDTSDGDKPYTWDGNSWEQAYTAIDGGDINTGTVDADRLSFTDGQGRISGDNLLIDASTTFSSPDIPDGALSEDYTAEGAESQSIRKDSPPGNGDVDGRGLRVGDVWVDTSDGDRPHTWDGNSWTKAYTSIKGGDIDTGSLYAVDATITSTLTMGNADTNGVITNPNEDFRVDKTGFTVSTASGFILENAYTIEDTDGALLPAFSLYGEKDNQNIRMVSRHDWTLDIDSDDVLELSAYKNVNIVSDRGRITMLPDADKLSYGVGGLEIVSIPNSMTADDDNALLDRGVGVKFEPLESDGSGNANKSDLEEVMGPNEAMLYAIRYKDDNIDLAWAETDSNGNIQNRSNTF